MALNTQSACAQVSNIFASADVESPRHSKAPGSGAGVLPLPVKPKFQSSSLRRTKSRKPVKIAKAVSATVQEASAVEENAGNAISQAVSKVGEEIATTSGEILDAVDSVIEDGPMRVRKKTGKTNSRTSRRRALVMCLALGMVRPCAGNIANSLQTNDLRRSASVNIRRTTSTSFNVPNNLVSQVSLASALKQTNLLGEKEDLQKLTTLQ